GPDPASSPKPRHAGPRSGVQIQPPKNQQPHPTPSESAPNPVTPDPDPASRYNPKNQQIHPTPSKKTTHPVSSVQWLNIFWTTKPATASCAGWPIAPNCPSANWQRNSA